MVLRSRLTGVQSRAEPASSSRAEHRGNPLQIRDRQPGTDLHPRGGRRNPFAATQPAALNDPFECAVAVAYVIPDASEENRVLAEALTQINESTPVTEEHVRNARQRYGSLFTRQLFAEQVSTKFGIVAFGADPQHPLMWAHYTTDGSGFAIGYDKSAIAKLAGANGALLPVRYLDHLDGPVRIPGPVVLSSPSSNLPQFLSRKSDHWRYENEWRLIVELNETIGTGETDRHGQPVNLVRVPNEAVVRVYYTERTPPESLETIRDRLANDNNRYQTDSPRKLVMSSTSYGYKEAPE